MSYARLELWCKDRKITVIFNHALRVISRQNNIPQFAILERRAETQAEEAKVDTKKQKNNAANTNIKAEKAPTDTEKATLQTEEAKSNAKKAKHYAEEAKVILLKTKKDYEEAIAKFKLNTLRPS